MELWRSCSEIHIKSASNPPQSKFKQDNTTHVDSTIQFYVDLVNLDYIRYVTITCVKA